MLNSNFGVSNKTLAVQIDDKSVAQTIAHKALLSPPGMARGKRTQDVAQPYFGAGNGDIHMGFARSLPWNSEELDTYHVLRQRAIF